MENPELLDRNSVRTWYVYTSIPIPLTAQEQYSILYVYTVRIVYTITVYRSQVPSLFSHVERRGTERAINGTQRTRLRLHVFDGQIDALVGYNS